MTIMANIDHCHPLCHYYHIPDDSPVLARPGVGGMPFTTTHQGAEMKTEIVCIIDRSGSMHAMQDDAIGGFNAFLATQKEQEGVASFTMVLFDHEVQMPYDGVDLQKVQPLTRETFVPRGNTALYDAICETVDSVGRRLAAMAQKDRPDQVIVVILTDGEENSSTRHTHRSVQERIEHQTEVYKWEFLFLAANIDAEAVAETFSIAKDKAYNFAASGQGSREAYSKLSLGVARYRRTSVVGTDWKD